MTPHTEHSIRGLLAKRYAPPAWAFLAQVRNQTGFRRRVRTADALAMGLYPSRGLDLHGFEIKVSRSDWLSELKQPDKADEIAAYCDYWWVVAPPRVVVPAELPGTWGLLETIKGGLRAVREPKRMEAQPLSRAFLAAILRKATEGTVPAAAVQDRINEAVDRAKEFQKSNQRYELERATMEAKRLRESIDEFERISGLRINGWGKGHVAEAVRLLENSDIPSRVDSLERMAGEAARISEYIEQVVSRWRESPECKAREAKEAVA